jgi:CRISPR-associated protein Cas6/Cse3/CasE subtype I-E
MYKTTFSFTYNEAVAFMREVFKSPSFDQYTVHKFVYNLFPIEKNAKFMFATKMTDDGIVICIYSDIRPVVDGMDNVNYSVKQVNVDELFKEGNTYTYQIQINCVKRKDGHNVLVRDYEFGEWFEKRMNANGMNLESINNLTYGRINVPTKTNSKGVPFHVASCMGRFTITDFTKFKDCLLNGIGREKAFGMGMLMVC